MEERGLENVSRYDGDDLPDHDYESIYGREALAARTAAWWAARFQAQREILERLDAIIAKHSSTRPQEKA